jgi:hypothetical protein
MNKAELTSNVSFKSCYQNFLTYVIGYECNFRGFLLWSVLYQYVLSYLLSPKIFLSILFLSTLNLCSHKMRDLISQPHNEQLIELYIYLNLKISAEDTRI